MLYHSARRHTSACASNFTEKKIFILVAGCLPEFYRRYIFPTVFISYFLRLLNFLMLHWFLAASNVPPFLMGCLRRYIRAYEYDKVKGGRRKPMPESCLFPSTKELPLADWLICLNFAEQAVLRGWGWVYINYAHYPYWSSVKQARYP